MDFSKKLVIGTAQFGQNYGITNTFGQVEEREAKLIIDKARSLGIKNIDTASSYGNSEQILGNIGVSDFEIITKLPSIKNNTLSCYELFETSIMKSLNDLKISRLNTVLLHRPEELAGPSGDHIYNALLKLKDIGLVDKVGISIYSPKLLDDVYSKYFFDVVQAPINVFDRRIINSGWLKRLSEMGVSVIARSVFLQGILLNNINSLPTYFLNWEKHFRKWNEFCNINNISAIQASMQFVLQACGVSKIIVGLESKKQFAEILEAIKKPIKVDFEDLEISDEALISPINWPT